MYRSQISDKKWIAYDIPSNVGWIMFLTGLALCALKRPEIIENSAIFALLVLDALCGAAMAVGIMELISERIAGLDRILPKRRLYRGFGALTFGGLLGLMASLLALVIAVSKGLEGAAFLCLLCVGGLLCALFAGLILREYKKVN